MFELPIIAALLTACSVTSVAALQSRGTASKLSAIGTVIIARAGQMGDPLPWDACSIYRLADRPAAMLASLPPGVLPLLDRRVNDPCAHAVASAPPGMRQLVRVIRSR